MISSSSPYAVPYRTLALGAPVPSNQPTAPVAAPVGASPAVPAPPVPSTPLPAQPAQPAQPGLLMRAQSFLSNLWDTVIGPFLNGLVGLFTGGA